MKDFNYNYVIIGYDGFYDVAYQDIKDLKNVLYYSKKLECFKTPLSLFLARAYYSPKLNRLIKFLLSFYVERKQFPPNFKEEKPICYIFFGLRNNVANKSYLKYLKRKHKNVKLVLFFQDIIASYKTLDLDFVNKEFDIILSYDKGDCEKYNFLYHPTPYSCVHIKPLYSEIKNDIYFCGKAKTRYGIIHEFYKRCIDIGLKCDFYVTEVPKNEQIYSNIHYDEPLTYSENLEKAMNSKAILEVMQDGAKGFTPRLWEAIMLDKRLITNNNFIKQSNFYNTDNILMINDNINDISDAIFKECVWKQSIKDCISPINWLSFIDNALNNLK